MTAPVLALDIAEIVVPSVSVERKPAPRPVALGLPAHGEAHRVLELEPVGRASGAVARADALRHDPFEPQRAGVLKHGVAVDVLAFDPCIEDEPGPCPLEQTPKPQLALLERLAAQIIAVDLDQVEGVEEHAGVPLLPRQQVE
jgi:hypothetical protein